MEFQDRVRETSTTTGTGNFTLAGAVSQYQAFSTAFNVGDVFPYCLADQSGTDWEVGFGRLVDATTLERTTIYQSSNSNSVVNFTSGTKDVFCTLPGFFMSRIEPMGHTVAKCLGYDMA